MATTSKKSSAAPKAGKPSVGNKSQTSTEKPQAPAKKTPAKAKKQSASTKVKQPAGKSQGAATKTQKTTTSVKKKSGSSRKPKLRYKQGQEIVYPLQGVGHINNIEERVFRNTRLLYYIIYLEVSDMTIMVPVDKADELGIRPIVDKKEANKALKLISEDFEPVPADWKARYQNNLDLLKKGSVLDIATVVRSLYHRSKIKELPILERKLYDSALKLLVDEISFSLQKGKEEIEALVLSKLNVN